MRRKSRVLSCKCVARLDTMQTESLFKYFIRMLIPLKTFVIFWAFEGLYRVLLLRGIFTFFSTYAALVYLYASKWHTALPFLAHTTQVREEKEKSVGCHVGNVRAQETKAFTKSERRERKRFPLE